MIYAIFESDWLTEWWDFAVSGQNALVEVIDHSVYLTYSPSKQTQIRFINSDIISSNCALEKLPEGQFQIIDRTEDIQSTLVATRRRLISSVVPLFEKGTLRFPRKTEDYEMAQLVYGMQTKRDSYGWMNFDGYQIFYSSAIYFRGDYEKLVVDSVYKRVVT